VDADVFLSISQLRVTLLRDSRPLPHSSHSRPPRPRDYIGKAISFSNLRFHGQQLTYMQGGAYMLSRRGAEALASCPFATYDECPNRHFRYEGAASEVQTRCFSRQTDNMWGAEDIWSGVCMLVANLSATPEPCMLTLGGTPIVKGESHRSSDPTATVREVLATLRAFRVRKSRCPCPISVHPLKSNASMWALRAEFQSSSCAGL